MFHNNEKISFFVEFYNLVDHKQQQKNLGQNVPFPTVI